MYTYLSQYVEVVLVYSERFKYISKYNNFLMLHQQKQISGGRGRRGGVYFKYVSFYKVFIEIFIDIVLHLYYLYLYIFTKTLYVARASPSMRQLLSYRDIFFFILTHS